MASQAELDALNAAIASGLRRVEHKDRIVEYQTIDQMIKARDDLAGQLGIAPSATSPLSGRLVMYAGHSKGTTC